MFSFSGFSGTYTAAHVIAPDGADGGWQWARTSVAAGSYVATPREYIPAEGSTHSVIHTYRACLRSRMFELCFSCAAVFA